MKTLRSRVMLLGAALGLCLVLGSFMLRPGSGPARSKSFPWAATAGVLGIGVVAYLAKRRTTGASQAGVERITCVEKMRLQPGKVLHLVEADGQRLLISTSENGVQLVCELGGRTGSKPEESS